MDRMTAKERFLKIFHHEPIDAPVVLAIEPYEVTVLERWREEGLPAGQSPEFFLGMDRMRKLPVKFGPLPPFPKRIISENGESFTETDSFGAVVRRRREAASMYYGYVDHPIKSRDDWIGYRERFRAETPGRVPDEAQLAEFSAGDPDQPMGIEIFPFFFRLSFYLMGMQRFLTAFYEEPDLIRDIFSWYGECTLRIVETALSRTKIDFASFGEDLAYCSGPHVSPTFYKEFWLPYQNRIVETLQEHQVPVIGLYSSGNLEAYIPALLESGINCLWPLERQAGMDPVRLREKFGKQLLLAGGFPKEALISGPAAIDRELERLAPLIRSGGFLPTVDDMIPPEVPFTHYRYYVEVSKRFRY